MNILNELKGLFTPRKSPIKVTKNVTLNHALNFIEHGDLNSLIEITEYMVISKGNIRLDLNDGTKLKFDCTENKFLSIVDKDNKLFNLTYDQRGYMIRFDNWIYRFDHNFNLINGVNELTKEVYDKERITFFI